MIDLTGYKLTFADEFDGRSISQTGANTKWADIRSEWRFDKNSDIGFGRSSFVDAASGYDPFQVKDGLLTITAVSDRTLYGYPGSWESGLITTQGVFSQKYGYFEMRADMSGTKGAWDAFWLLPDTQTKNPLNPNSWQEIDVVEHYGNWDRGVYSAIHTTDLDKQSYSATQSYAETYLTSGFHTYGVLWTKETISFYLDGRLTSTKPTPSDMHNTMYILANLAVEDGADPNGAPLQTKIDYIRAYAASDSPDAAFYHIGTSGNDRLVGDSADETFRPMMGANVIDGGDGRDTLELIGKYSSYSHLTFEGKDYLYQPGELDRIGSIEVINFADFRMPWTEAKEAVKNFDPGAYIASYSDLIEAFGHDNDAATQHFINTGFDEGRIVTFDSLEYIASYKDLTSAFGTDAARGAQHFIEYGVNEGRTITFDGWAYLASYSDLIQAFGADVTKATQHFIQTGVNEGRMITFNGLEYLASNKDLIPAFGTDAARAVQHYVEWGAKEGRTTTFNGWEYLASYGDLIEAFGADVTKAAKHFVEWGAKEGRSISFDALAYAAANSDVAAAFGDDSHALARHYVMYGFAEGRSLKLDDDALTAMAPAAGHIDATAYEASPVTVSQDTWSSHADAGHSGAWAEPSIFSLTTDPYIFG
jgi:beta-glucanase (GH16 family)